MTGRSALHRQSPWWMPALLLHLIQIIWNLSRHPQSWSVPVKCLGFFFLPTFLLLALLNAPFCTSTLALYLYVIPTPLYYVLGMLPLTPIFFRLLNTSHHKLISPKPWWYKESIRTRFSFVFGGLALLYEVIPKLQCFFTGIRYWTEHSINYSVPPFRNLKRALWNVYKRTLYHRKLELYEISGNSEIYEHLWEVWTSACKVQANFQQCEKVLHCPADLYETPQRTVSSNLLSTIPSGDRLSTVGFSCRRMEMDILRWVHAA